MREIKRVLVTRSGNGASYSTNHPTLSDAEKIYSGLWNSKFCHITIQIDYTDGTTDILSNK